MKETNSDLKSTLEQTIKNLATAFEEFAWSDEKAYANWLAQTYYFVRHTTTFLALVAASYGPTKRKDQYHTLKHLKEEMNHDLLALDDLKALGYELSDFPELPETSAFYQSQYYYIQYMGPSTLLGYSMCLEGIAATKAAQMMQVVLKAHGPKVVRFFKSHAAADLDHIQEGFKNLETVTPEEAQSIIKNAKQCEFLYKSLLDRIKKSAGTKQALKIAA